MIAVFSGELSAESWANEMAANVSVTEMSRAMVFMSEANSKGAPCFAAGVRVHETKGQWKVSHGTAVCNPRGASEAPRWWIEQSLARWALKSPAGAADLPMGSS